MGASAAIDERVPKRGRAERLRTLLWGRRRRGDHVVLTFALASLAAMVVIAVAGALVLRERGLSQAIDQARVVTRVTGEGIVAPRVTAGALRGDPRALRRLDRTVHRYALHNPVTRIKLWTPGGRIAYSDEHALIGKRFPLGADEREILAHGGVAAASSDLSRPENRYERGGGDLLEVYLPIRAANGRRLLFESYQRYSSVATSGERVWLAFAPVLVGGLLLLLLFQLPLARSLVRRLRAGQAESERLLRTALEASDAERRRLAADLHDGAVQDLVGVSYTLSAAARDADPAQRERLQEAATRTRATIRDLRTLLVDLYPPNLERAGLPAALRDLTVNLEHHGVQATLDAPRQRDAAQARAGAPVPHRPGGATQRGRARARHPCRRAGGLGRRHGAPDRHRRRRGFRSPGRAGRPEPGALRPAPAQRSCRGRGRIGDHAVRGRRGRDHHRRGADRMTRILVVDDHAVVREGLLELLGGEDDLEVVGAVAGGEEAIEAARTLRPDVVLMDLEMDGTDGVQATQRIKDADPHPQVVVLTSFSDQSRILAALDAGARGYLLKDATPDELVEGIQSAAKGDAPLAQPAINAIVAARAGEGGLPELSERERDVLVLLADGQSNKAIARRLDIAEKTVKAHLTSAFRRIGATNRVEAALWAKQNRLT